MDSTSLHPEDQASHLRCNSARVLMWQGLLDSILHIYMHILHTVTLTLLTFNMDVEQIRSRQANT